MKEIAPFYPFPVKFPTFAAMSCSFLLFSYVLSSRLLSHLELTMSCSYLAIGGHKSVNRYTVNNEANFFINSLIR